MTNLELIYRARKGNEEAANRIFKEYNNLILLTAKKYFFYGADHDDVIQEASIGLIKAIHSFCEGKNASFKTFAFLCIKRQLITAIKSSNSGKQRILNIAISNSSEIISKNYENTSINMFSSTSFNNPEDSCISKEKMKLLKKFIKSNLSKMENEILEYMLLEMTYTEIAEILDREPKSIDNAIQRIKKKIKVFINEYDSI
ncbi:sigma-70 family RNA polymerase sigma factor [Fusobacterium sp.]|uniref:sigma-70 family RNA polymerase sigma factor n=1 Tax=Fusobacterium sp. TaxID=68766 RepID=UPI0028FF1AB0|nr:sigma-70 family RNA polymerase sigma factor [Fusobacterium sp.]MDU1911616.1 sigma-70 family RNA polymerase sigma factor [Fusobacterium sp.]